MLPPTLLPVQQQAARIQPMPIASKTFIRETSGVHRSGELPRQAPQAVGHTVPSTSPGWGCPGGLLGSMLNKRPENLPREPTSTTPIAGSASISPITKPDDADGRSSISGTRRDPARARDTLQMEQMGMRVEYLRGCSHQLRSADRSYWLLSRLSLRQLPSHARVDQWAMHRWAWQQVPPRQWPAPSKRRLSGNISCIPKMETSRQPPRATKQCHRLGFPRTRLLTPLWVMLWVPREPLWGPLRTQQQLPQPLRVLQVLRRAAVVQKTRLEIDLTLCADDGIASWHRCQMLLLGQQLLPAYRQAFACCSPARAWYWRGKRRVSNGDCCFGMSLDSTIGRTAFPCFSGLPTGVWDLLATLHGAHFVAFMFHAVHFDDAGQPCVPEGVNREEWLLELPFILGTALNRSLPCSESGSEEGTH